MQDEIEEPKKRLLGVTHQLTEGREIPLLPLTELFEQ
jgi:hypothetical protein